MASKTIDPLHWKTIIERMAAGHCVPFLGAAVNVKSDDLNYQGLPLGPDVARGMVEEILDSQITDLGELKKIETFKRLLELKHYQSLARVSVEDLGRVSLHVKHVTDYVFFTGLLKKLIPDLDCKPSVLLQTLARIPNIKLVVTTNYDNLMERALEEAAEPWDRIVQRADGFDKAAREKIEAKMQSASRIVYKIHGTFHEEEFDNGGQDADPFSRLIITEDDYIQFLTVLGKHDDEREGVPQSVRERFVYSTLLFLGYGLEDWDFRTLYKGLIESLPYHKQRLSFAIQKDPSEFLVQFWNKRGVIIYDMDVYEFAGQLREKCRAAGLYKEPPAPAA